MRVRRRWLCGNTRRGPKSGMCRVPCRQCRIHRGARAHWQASRGTDCPKYPTQDPFGSQRSIIQRAILLRHRVVPCALEQLVGGRALADPHGHVGGGAIRDVGAQIGAGPSSHAERGCRRGDAAIPDRARHQHAGARRNGVHECRIRRRISIYSLLAQFLESRPPGRAAGCQCPARPA
ncbi:hypothetical protein G6F24_015318 [Rhizopus arrhizus]|nr:hypothetical protein G6F24_015318 [Rhizopus arrhizus]